jgi:hypothetical protein
MTSRMLAIPFALGLLSSFVACSDEGGDVGAPCSVDADCASGLICDEHEGQASCQEAHGHEGEESEHASETGHAETEHASETGHQDSGSSGHAHESGETGHDSGSGSGSGSGSSTGA